jgi:hypothetical protein
MRICADIQEGADPVVNAELQVLVQTNTSGDIAEYCT